MCRLYMAYQWVAKRWLYLAPTLFLAGTAFGHLGYAEARSKWDFSTDFYHVLKLFALDDPAVDENTDNAKLEVARRLGAALWSFTVVSLLVGIFSERATDAFVALLARNHYLFCGLGARHEGREQLIKWLRGKGKNVVLIESDADYPVLTTCKDAGVVTLRGCALDKSDLLRAQLHRAADELIDPHAIQPTDAEIERLAQKEHEDWVADRQAHGWSLGNAAEQSRARRGATYNENMKAWAQLDEHVREYDRNIIRRMPIVMAKADHKLVEVSSR